MALSASPQAYRAGQHRLALALAFGTFLLIIFGALVTSNSAGLAVPDWPTSFGSLYKVPPMVAGIKYEHGHRMWAEFMGLLTVLLALRILITSGLGKIAVLAVSTVTCILAVMVFAVRGPVALAVVFTLLALTCIGLIVRSYRSSWTTQSKLSLIALATVLAQGALGGITVLNFLPWAVSTAHAAVGQTFFCITVLMALFTSRAWIETEAESAGHADSNLPSARFLAGLSITAVYVQLILGAAFRHSGMKLLPHLISAVFVTLILFWTGFRAMSIAPLRRLGMFLTAGLVTQLFLGFASYLTRVRWGANAVQPELSMILSTVAHVATGAFLLAICFLLAAQTSKRLLPAPKRQPATGKTAQEVMVA